MQRSCAVCQIPIETNLTMPMVFERDRPEVAEREIAVCSSPKCQLVLLDILRQEGFQNADHPDIPGRPGH